MTILMFFYSLPACIALVILSLVLALLVTPRTIGLLCLPILPLVGIHLYMLPHMYHGDEIAAFSLQAAISALALLSFRIVRRRSAAVSADSFLQDSQGDTPGSRGSASKFSIDKNDYLPLESFASQKEISEEKLVAMIREGLYSGRLFDGEWFVHKDEL
ncbi:MAG: hypothetical protein ABJ308_08020 [Halieaceae bacterium]